MELLKRIRDKALGLVSSVQQGFTQGAAQVASNPQLNNAAQSFQQRFQPVVQNVNNKLPFGMSLPTSSQELTQRVNPPDPLLNKITTQGYGSLNPGERNQYVGNALDTAMMFGTVAPRTPKIPQVGTGKKIFENLFRSSKGVIERSGQSGKKTVDLLNKTAERGAFKAGEKLDSLQKTLSTLTKQELDTFADVVEGRMSAITPMQDDAVKAWGSISKDIYNKAQKAGVKMGQIKNYFPHYTLDGARLTNEAGTGSIKFGKLENSRLTDLPYNKSTNVLFDYVKNAYQRIEDAKSFGPKDEKLTKLVKQASKESGRGDKLTSYVDQIRGVNLPQNKVADTIRNVQSFKLNPGTSVLNLTQNISTAIKTDIPTTTKAVVKALTNPKESYSWATKVGEIDPKMAKMLEDYSASGNMARGWIRLIGMQGSERFNRVVASVAGRDYGQKLVYQALKGSSSALRELERLGVNPNQIGNGATEDILKRIARNVSQSTQFSTSAGELPYAWKTPWGKVITQFKSFAFKQSKFVGEEVKRTGSETIRGNFKPLVNALVAVGVVAPIAGEIVADFKSLIQNKKRQDVDTLTERYFSNVANATSLGLLDSLGGLKYGETGVAGMIGGPTASDAVKAVSGASDISSAIQGEDVNLNPVKRNALRTVPGAGQFLANTLVPNTYVENYLGPNQGLSQTDTTTYNLMKGNPQAETFKKEQQASYKQESSDKNFFSRLFNKKSPESGLTEVATGVQGMKSQKKTLNNYLEAGGDVSKISDKVIKEHLFSGLDYSKGDISDRNKVLKGVTSIVNDERYTEDQKNQLLEKSGVPEKDLEYYKMATMDSLEKRQGLVEFANGSFENREELIVALAGNKKTVGGKAISGTGDFDYLYDQGIISKDEKSLLNAIKYDEIKGEFYMDRDYKPKTGGLTDSQRRAMITRINSIFRYEAPKRISQSANTMQPPKMPTLELPKLTSVGSTRTKDRWFNAY